MTAAERDTKLKAAWAVWGRACDVSVQRRAAWWAEWEDDRILFQRMRHARRVEEDAWRRYRAVCETEVMP
jgi:hypothetical protein